MRHRSGQLKPVTREILEEAQVASLIRSWLRPQWRRCSSPGATFLYLSGPDGARGRRARPRQWHSGATLAFRAQPGQPGAATAPVAIPEPDLGPSRDALEILLRLLKEQGGSDLHLRVGEPPLLRRDGDLVRIDAAPLEPEQLEHMLLSIMSPLAKSEYREHSDADWAWEIEGVARFRANAGRDRNGPMAVFRLIPAQVRSPMGLSPQIQVRTSPRPCLVTDKPEAASRRRSRRSTWSMPPATTHPHHRDPIEFVHQNNKCLINQREVRTHTNSFKAALRAALREDPDILLVGELRDLETVAIAIETAETGHLVFGTLHTTTAASTVDRIIDQFPSDRQSQIRIMLSESLRGVIAQTLCRKIGGGRVAALEVLIANGAVSNLIREGKTFQIPSLMQVNKAIGMVSLNDALLDLVAKKLVAPDEAHAKAVDKAGFESQLKRLGIDPKALAPQS
jgi:twitching motility protein PilT